jgi:two-component system phosphate regulon sensor histidine kinase PhoR
MSKTDNVDNLRLRTILNSMIEAVFVTDDKGRVILTNKALDDLIAQDVRGRRAKNVIKNKELRLAIRKARKKLEATSTELETEIGDKMHIFHAQVAPLPNDEGVVTVLHDVTSLKDADRIRRNFVANASHELRTPLTAIRGFAETLIDGAAEDPETRRRFLDAIFRHTIRLERLVKDLTVLGQAESPQFEWETELTDVGRLCRQSVDALETQARAKEIRIVLELPPEPIVLKVSPNAIDHVLVNLIENAIKYSPHGSEVRVTLKSLSDQVTVEVIDHGPGIPTKYLDRIFERFYRVDKGRSRGEGGTGLGLSIARNIVERIGGTLDAQSTLGEGSTFRLGLPLDPLEDDVDDVVR